MNIFLRSFNSRINSKTGDPLPAGQTRGTPEWHLFEELLRGALNELGCTVYDQPENPREPDRADWASQADYKIAVHRCRRDLPDYHFFYMQMHMRNLFTLDTNGWGADHSENSDFDPQSIDAASARLFCEETSSRLLASGESKCEQPEAGTANPIDDYLLIPLQVPRDYVLIHHSKISVLQFVLAVGLWADAAKIRVAFKLHPYNRFDYDIIKAVNLLSQNSDYIFNVTGNIHSLIQKSTGVFVINSGTGFEALLHGKPVVTFGACDYETATFRAEVSNLNSAADYVHNFSEVNRIYGQRFCYWYHFFHAYDIKMPEHTQQRMTNYFKKRFKA